MIFIPSVWYIKLEYQDVETNTKPKLLYYSVYEVHHCLYQLFWEMLAGWIHDRGWRLLQDQPGPQACPWVLSEYFIISECQKQANVSAPVDPWKGAALFPVFLPWRNLFTRIGPVTTVHGHEESDKTEYPPHCSGGWQGGHADKPKAHTCGFFY